MVTTFNTPRNQRTHKFFSMSGSRGATRAVALERKLILRTAVMKTGAPCVRWTLQREPRARSGPKQARPLVAIFGCQFLQLCEAARAQDSSVATSQLVSLARFFGNKYTRRVRRSDQKLTTARAFTAFTNSAKSTAAKVIIGADQPAAARHCPAVVAAQPSRQTVSRAIS